MAHREKYAQALKMRKRGLPYSTIKEKLGVSKSTLSYWLRDFPLSRERINSLRAMSPRRIERFRNTMEKKRALRLSEVRKKVADNIGKLSKRELFLAGLFLYWGEGGKTKRYSITLANTDSNMIRFYLKWLEIMEIPPTKIKVRLHLYTDMDIEKETRFWIRETGIPKRNFQKPHLKKTLYKEVIQRGFGHGTCNIIVDGRDISEYVLESLRVLGEMY